MKDIFADWIRSWLVVPTDTAPEELPQLASVPLREWPAFESSVEPLVAKPTAGLGPGDYP